MVVTGLENTVKAIGEWRVHTLVMVDGARLEGSMCAGCGWVEPAGASQCSHCNKPAGKVEDVSEQLAVAAVEHDAEVLYVKAGSGLEKQGSIGAILRW